MKPIDQIIIEFFQRRSSSEDIHELNNWIESPANKKELNDYSKIWLWTHQLKERKPEVEFNITWQKINDRGNTKNKGTIWLYSLARYAAVILIVLNVGWWGARYYYQSASSKIEQHFQVSADQSANSVVLLPDNTLVYLRQGSNLHYNSQFTSKNREVSLEGEAYFEVTSDKEHPFFVKTENAQVKVLGTRFNVSAEKGSPICQTTLVEGKVEFITNNGKRYLLLPNQMIELNSEIQAVNIKQVNPELYIAWKDGKIIFRDETLGEITSKLERIYHVKFIYKNADLAEKYRFSGTFHRETSIGDVITMLKLSIPMNVSREEKFPDPDTIYLR